MPSLCLIQVKAMQSITWILFQLCSLRNNVKVKTSVAFTNIMLKVFVKFFSLMEAKTSKPKI